MPEKALCTKMEQKLELEEKRQIMNLKREKTKRNILLVLQIAFIVLTFVGAGYVILNHGEPNAGYAVVPMLGALIFGMLFINSQKTIHDNTEK